VEDYLDGNSVVDPRFNKWVAYVYTSKAGDDVVYSEISVHPCTKADFAEFSRIKQSQFLKFEMLTTSPKRQLYCLDFGETEIYLRG